MAKQVADYAMIGDGETAALVGRNGSIDWLCWPRFDSDACFAGLIGDDENGCWTMAAETRETTRSRAYCGNTLVLQTEITTATGTVRVVDFMPLRHGQSSAVIRIVSGLDGTVALRTDLRLRFDYGSVAPWFDETKGTFIGKVGPDLVVMRSDAPFERNGDALSARFSVRAGQRLSFTLQHGASTALIPDPVDADRLLAETKTWWLDWISKFDRKTEWPDVVKRSLITLKALTYFPTGGVVAAPTTSLPEKPGGSMNWDYRYCWLRDSTFMMTAFLNAGLKDEAAAWLYWLLRAIGDSPHRLRIAYRIDGGRRLEEWTADWLRGFGGARPVRVGNAAAGQVQLDVFGEVLDSSHLAERAGIDRSERGFEIEHRLVQHVAAIWREPDRGLWEARGSPKQYVYSKVMAWVAVDRFLKMAETVTKLPHDKFQRLNRLRDEMHAEICQKGFNERYNTFGAQFYSHQIDASLLLLPLVGFLPIDDSRVAGTIAAVEDQLMEGGFVRRQKAAAFGTEEGVFIACSCWLADCMTMQGRRDEARDLLGRVIGLANDVGLLSEEYHVPQKRLVGNMPQALCHLALVNSILGLSGPVLQRGGG